MASVRAPILVAIGAWACSRAPVGTPVGISDSLPEPPRATRVEPPIPSWPDLALARDWPEAAPAFTALSHRRGSAQLRVRVVPSALEAYRALASEAPMPEGARIAAFQEGDGGEVFGVYVLEKKAGVWSALELDGRGTPVAGDGRLCLRCHQMAPTDFLFGVTARAAVLPP